MRQFNYKCIVSKNGNKMYYKRVGGKWKRISNKLGKNAEKGKKKYEILKDEIHKDEIPKDEILKDEILKDEILKDEIPKDEIPKDEKLIADLDISNNQFRSEKAKLLDKKNKILQKIYSNLSAWQKVQVARHPNRPHAKDYINLIFEKYIGGQEIQVAVMNGKAIGAIELRPRRGFYDYKAKYYKSAKTAHVMPADIPNKEYKKEV